MKGLVHVIGMVAFSRGGAGDERPSGSGPVPAAPLGPCAEIPAHSVSQRGSDKKEIWRGIGKCQIASPTRLNDTLADSTRNPVRDVIAHERPYRGTQGSWIWSLP